MADREFWYPTTEDVIRIHDDIVEDDPESESGIEDPERIEYALDFIEHGHFDEGPETVHEKAFHLIRLLASNHWFVDGNKRTALNTTELFYFINGYEFEYGEDIRSMLKLFSVREDLIDREVGVQYFADQTSSITLEPLELLALILDGGKITALLETIELEEILKEITTNMEKHHDFPPPSEGPTLEEFSPDKDTENDHND